MTWLKFFQVDAFTDRIFGGNPAAVCPLKTWPDDKILRSIAAENNLSETAFFVPSGNYFELRWFTPVREVDLCGHATLASAHVLFEHLGYSGPSIAFKTRSGELTVIKNEELLEMDFPAYAPKPCAIPDFLVEGLGKMPEAVLEAEDYIAVYGNEEAIRSIVPDYSMLVRLGLRGVCVTAPGNEGVDFVSRFFAPKLGVPEDPVCGSAHCELAPYWAGRFDKNAMKARQVSGRGGEIFCEVKPGRVIISGSAVTIIKGEIYLP